MILKKPYAFLIRHFKKIHLLLLFPVSYMILRISTLYNYFNSYVNSGWLLNNTFKLNEYINFLMFVICLSSLIIFVFIYALLVYKKKPKLIYLGAIVLYLVMLVYLFVSYNTLEIILRELVDVRKIRALKDMGFIILGANYVILIVLFIRGIGFNLKQFDFSEETKAFEVSKEDNEEFEILLNIDKKKFLRDYTRKKRFLKYFILENLKLVKIMGITIILGLLLIISLNIFVYNPVYGENRNVQFDYFDFNVNNSWVTKEDYKGSKITPEGYSYVIVEFTLKNSDKYKQLRYLSMERINLNTRESKVPPILNKNDSFKDLGKFYDEERLAYNEKGEYILVFLVLDTEISDEKKLINRKMLLEYTSSIKIKTKGIITRYKKIRLNPSQFEELREVDLLLNEKIDFTATHLSKGNLTIKSYDILSFFSYSYNECIGELCELKTKNITPNIFSEVEKTVLYVTADLDDLGFSLYNFIDSFGTIKYRLNEVVKSNMELVNNLSPIGVKEKVYFEVAKEMEDATDIWIEFNVRSNRYNYYLRKSSKD